MPDESEAPVSLMRCIECRSHLMPSGLEPHRLICMGCGQNYFLRMQLVKTDPLRRLALPGSVEDAK